MTLDDYDSYEDPAYEFAGKANMCTHAGILSLAIPVFKQLDFYIKLCHVQHEELERIKNDNNRT